MSCPELAHNVHLFGPSSDITNTVSQPEAHFSTPLCPYPCKTGRLSFVVVWWWHQLAEPNFPEYERASSHVQPPHLRLARGSFCSGEKETGKPEFDSGTKNGSRSRRRRTCVSVVLGWHARMTFSNSRQRKHSSDMSLLSMKGKRSKGLIVDILYVCSIVAAKNPG